MANSNISKSLAEMITKRMRDDIENNVMQSIAGNIKVERNDCEQKTAGEIWKPPMYELEELRKTQERKFNDNMMQDWENMRRRDPDEKFRREIRNDIKEIKDAIRKVGILLDSDKPSEKVLEQHKMLKEAYKKYKMIEALVLGETK